MKPSSSVLAILLHFLLSSFSWATLDTFQINNFLHCLANNSLPSKPMTQAIYTPQNSSFSSTFQSYARNCRVIPPNPDQNLVAIVTALHESHIQATVICTKANNLLLRTRSGGHDYEGLSYTSKVPFVILDMFNLRDITIDLASDTTWVQAGATLGEVYYNIAAKSKVHAFPAGVCPTIGVGGHISGGGFGTLVRKYGLAVDNTLDAQVVDVNGRILDRKAMGEDFFWAINGGGGASFGVVLSWKIKLVRVPEVVTVFTTNRIIEQGDADLIHRWQEVSSKLHEDISVRLELRPLEKTVQATFIGFYLGNIEKLIPLMRRSFPELGLQKGDCTEMSWIESTLYFYSLPRETPIEVLLDRAKDDKTFSKMKSDYVKKPISKEGLEFIFQRLIQIRDVFMQWNPYGGRMSEIPATQTPPPQRDGYLFKIQYLSSWVEASMNAHYLNSSRQFYDSMSPYVTNSPREAFFNYRDLDIGNSPQANATFEEGKVYGIKYFNRNFQRLVIVKTKVDPLNFFRNEQSIPTVLDY